MNFKMVLRHILNSAADNKLPGNLSVPIVGVVNASAIPLPGDTTANYTLAHLVEDYSDSIQLFSRQYGSGQTGNLILGDILPEQLDSMIAAASLNDSVVV